MAFTCMRIYYGGGYMAILLFRGKECTKKVGGGSEKLLPFVGIEEEKEGPMVCLGFILESDQSGYVAVRPGPQLILPAWRGMQVFQEVPVVIEGTLTSCLYAGDQTCENKNAQSHLRWLGGFLGEERLASVREEAFKQTPGEHSLLSVMNLLRRHRFQGFDEELQAAITGGHTVPLSVTKPIEPPRTLH